MKRTKWISTDAWRGYEQPINAVVGASDTGMAADSPAPSKEVISELNWLARVLKEYGVSGVRRATTKSSNVFMIKRWLVVDDAVQRRKAKKVIRGYLNDARIKYAHEVD